MIESGLQVQQPEQPGAFEPELLLLQWILPVLLVLYPELLWYLALEHLLQCRH